ncbi:MAG: hypothetical protein HYT12_02800 [Candidatus Liptonbacteria bacterium]|nr:hypothetical protein [Candidatus Liptonbacteria bacterium]
MPKFKYIVIVLAILLATALIAVVLPKLSLRNQYGSMNQADEAVRNLKVMLNRGVTQVQYLINETNFLLANLARSKIIAGKDAKACGSLLASYLKRDEKKFTNFVVADLWGDIWCSSSPINPLEDRINVADRAYFQRVMREGGGGAIFCRRFSSWKN